MSNADLIARARNKLSYIVEPNAFGLLIRDLADALERAEQFSEAANVRLRAYEQSLQRAKQDALQSRNLRHQVGMLIKHLAHIHALIHPEDIRLPDGRIFAFDPKDKALELEAYKALCEAIRGIPAAIDAAIAREEHGNKA